MHLLVSFKRGMLKLYTGRFSCSTHLSRYSWAKLISMFLVSSQSLKLIKRWRLTAKSRSWKGVSWMESRPFRSDSARVIEFMGSHSWIAGVCTILTKTRWVGRPDERSLGVCFRVWKMAGWARARVAHPRRPRTPRLSLKSPPWHCAEAALRRLHRVSVCFQGIQYFTLYHCLSEALTFNFLNQPE